MLIDAVHEVRCVEILFFCELLSFAQILYFISVYQVLSGTLRYCYNRCIHICIKQGSLYRLLFVGDVSDETYNKRVLDTCSLHCFFFLVFGNNNTKDSSYSKLTDGLSSTCYLVRIIYTDNLIFRICFQGYTR